MIDLVLLLLLVLTVTDVEATTILLQQAIAIDPTHIAMIAELTVTIVRL